MPTFAITEKVVIDSASITQAQSITAGSRVQIDESISVGTDTLVALNVDVSQVRACYIHSDKAITLETNAVDATGGNTLVLVADLPYVWYTNKYDSFKFTADITALYVTNAAGASARLRMEFLIDPTV